MITMNNIFISTFLKNNKFNKTPLYQNKFMIDSFELNWCVIII